ARPESVLEAGERGPPSARCASRHSGSECRGVRRAGAAGGRLVGEFRPAARPSERVSIDARDGRDTAEENRPPGLQRGGSERACEPPHEEFHVTWFKPAAREKLHEN